MSHLPSLMALRCFDTSARHASFTKAAAELHLTQGAVSHQVLGLEAQLGAPLFLRRRGGLQLTSAGQAYWLEVSPALRQIERATHNIATHKGHGGTLKLSVASSFGAYWLIPRLSSFVGAHPEITLELSTHVGPVALAASNHDAAIEFCDGAAPGLRAELVLPLVVRLYAPPSLLGTSRKRGRDGHHSRQALARLLATQPLIRHVSVPEAWPGWLREAGLLDAVPPEHLAGGPQYDLLSMGLNGAIAGQGLVLLPDYAAAGALANGQLVRLSDVTWAATRGYYLRYPEWKADLVVIRRFREWLSSQANLSGRSRLRSA